MRSTFCETLTTIRISIRIGSGFLRTILEDYTGSQLRRSRKWPNNSCPRRSAYFNTCMYFIVVVCSAALAISDRNGINSVVLFRIPQLMRCKCISSAQKAPIFESMSFLFSLDADPVSRSLVRFITSY